MTLTQTQTPSPLGSYLDQQGIDVTTYQHEAVFTVTESQTVKQHLTGAHTKNLFLKDKKGRLFLVVACDDTSIDLKWLSKRLSAGRLSFGRPEVLLETLGVTPGSVTPFALLNDTDRRVRLVFDARMMAHDQMNFHPLDNTMTTVIGKDDLLKFIKSLGYDLEIIDME
jgi:Ala-tRNA(Pro) deacylase